MCQVTLSVSSYMSEAKEVKSSATPMLEQSVKKLPMDEGNEICSEAVQFRKSLTD